MLYLLLACIGIAAVAVYLFVIFTEVPGAAAERWGELEGLPKDLGKWTTDEQSESGRAAHKDGRVREVRTWREPASGLIGRDRLLLQVRYRDAKTGEITSVEPDQPVKRRRVKRPI